jgi:hypothetical protein
MKADSNNTPRMAMMVALVAAAGIALYLSFRFRGGPGQRRPENFDVGRCFLLLVSGETGAGQ